MKISLTLTALTLSSVILTSCGKPGEPSAKPEPDVESRLTIAVIPKGTTHEFWKSIHAGAVKASIELGVDIVWQGPLKEDDRDNQISVVEQMTTRRVDGIVLAPLDDAALRNPVASAKRAGIPVVIFDSGIKSDDHVSFVATDNKKGGYLGGKRLAELLEGKGKVIMLRYQEGSASTMNREQGFLDAMQEYEDIQLVSANQYAGATAGSAFTASDNLLARFTGEDGLTIDGIFCPNESSTFGMLRALQEGRFAGNIKFVGFDSSKKLVLALAKGEINGLVLQDPLKMGYMGVKTIVTHIRGGAVEKRIDTGVGVATPENMQEPEMTALLSPDFKKWLGE
jgi:ribose transport system substrate-binding protein